MSTISYTMLKNAVREVLSEQKQQEEKDDLEFIKNGFVQKPTGPAPLRRTQDMIDDLIKSKQHKNVKPSVIKTYIKRLKPFAKKYPILPEDPKVIREYMGRFTGSTGRYRLNHYDILNMLYKHCVEHMGILHNPVEELDRPIVNKKPINTLLLSEVRRVNDSIENTKEKAVWQLLVGHGWRQIEVRRIEAKDVRESKDGMILVHGKEREEFTPLLPETQALLEKLAENLADDEIVIRGDRIRARHTQPLGETGVAHLINKVLERGGINKPGHDLRRTCSTIVQEASGDEFVAMRLLRDKIPGVNDRYINYGSEKLKAALAKFSPLRLIKLDQNGESLVETGES